VADIAAGGWHSMALSADGQIYVWGRCGAAGSDGEVVLIADGPIFFLVCCAWLCLAQ
jgi:alpha-tubulin suppressor-like RCC1 family protein